MKRYVILAALLFTVSLHVVAQSYKSYPLREANTLENGIFYSVPQTELVLKVKVEKTVHKKGVYSESAYLLGIDNASVKDKETYKIKSVCLLTQGVFNPEQQYYLTYGDNTDIELTDNGILKSISSNNNKNKSKTQNQNITTPSVKEKVPEPIANSIFEQDAMRNGILTKHPFLTAQQAVNEIKRLREQQIKILSGDVEGTYINTTVDFMYKQLDEIINGYVALFTGSEVTSEEEFTFSIVPQRPIIIEEDLLLPVFKFSQQRGISALNAKNEDMKVIVRIHTKNQTKNVASIINGQSESKDFKNKVSKTGVGVYYSIPERVDVSVEYGNETLTQKNVGLAQYGTVSCLINGNKNLTFDTSTGAISEIK
ncbi:MAG: DUF4831 family protein [Bacteroidales bacterium]|nr:DUF4831 family protein [Bacteroidales bacterium]